MLFFWADDGSHGFELWKSDGTRDGTLLVRDINPGSRGSITFDCIDFSCGPEVESLDVDGTLFFRAYDEDTGSELWKTDGSAAGTMRVKDINPGMNESAPSNLTNVDGALFFTAHDGSTGYGIWKSDGTEAGTVRVTQTLGQGFPLYLTAVNGMLFFAVRVVAGDDGAGFDELWRSDGTEAGTVPVKQLPDYLSNYLSNLININGTLLFSVGAEVWRSDGTAAGTRPIASPLYWRSSFTLAGGHIFFPADDVSGSGTELWALPLSALGAPCMGDCDGDGAVTIDELVRGVNLALGNSEPSACPAFGLGGSGMVTIDQLIAAVGSAIRSCDGPGAAAPERHRGTPPRNSSRARSPAAFEADGH
jgi:ELWxxDGT repeat protein